MPIGRPTKLTQPIQQEILDRLASGESARSVCRDERMPDWKNLCIFKRKPENDAFRNQYVAARKEGMEARMDDVWEKVQDTSRDVIYDEVESTKQDGTTVVRKIAKSDNTAVNRDKLIADQARWEAARIYKDLFGDKQQVEHSGSVEIISNVFGKKAD